MFIINKYTKWYYQVIANAVARNLTTKKQATATLGYTELHHITPVSLGGSNLQENKVVLTAREHFICHWLLPKMTDSAMRSKMIYALNGMRRKNKTQDRYETQITSRVYENARKESARLQSIENTGKANLSQRGKPKSAQHKEKLRQANLGKKRSANSIAKQSATMTGRTRSADTCTAISNGLKGRISPTKGMKYSDEVKAKIAAARRNMKRQYLSDGSYVMVQLNTIL